MRYLRHEAVFLFLTLALCSNIILSKLAPKFVFVLVIVGVLWICMAGWLLFVLFKSRRKEKLDQAWKISVNKAMSDKLRAHLKD